MSTSKHNYSVTAPPWPEPFLNASEIEKYLRIVEDDLNQFENSHSLEGIFNKSYRGLYLNIACWIHQHKIDNQTLIIGINGAQGSGKSTMSGLLSVLLKRLFDQHTVVLSIDDLYLSRDKRKQLASDVHPLLQTRGVPGTHDVKLGIELLQSMRSRQQNKYFLPRFSKALDEPLSHSEWIEISKPPDIVLFEGWCLGAKPQSSDDLIMAVNSLESMQDPKAIWRTYVNDRLANEYQSLFNMLDLLLMLKVPSMQQVYEWRSLQEHKLREKTGAGMSDAELNRFIMHFERLTLHQLEEMPSRADIVMTLGRNHQISGVHIKR